MNLEKEMLALNVRKGPHPNVVAEACEILIKATEEEKEALRRAGLSSAMRAVRDAHDARLRNERVGMRIFDIKQIAVVAKRYGLRFLPVDKYNGGIPGDLGSKILAAETALGGRLDNYFVLAPKHAFTLSEKPIPPPDPLLFAMIPGGQYYLVHKWGNDLSIFRRVKYLFLRNHLTLWMPIIAAYVLSLIVADRYVTAMNTFAVATLVIAGISLLVVGSWAIFMYCIDRKRTQQQNTCLSQYSWQSPWL